MRMSKSQLDGEVTSGLYPPHFLYAIAYTNPEGKGIEPDWMSVHLHGADEPLSFSCLVKQEIGECIYIVMAQMSECIVMAY